MKNLNRFQFIGNLTKDTELRYTAKSTPIAIFDIAVNGSYKDQETGEIKEYTDFFRIKVWGKAAENAAKFLGKGSQVFVEGVSLDIENYCTLRLFFDLSTLAGLNRRNLPEAGILLLFQI
ncbi:single-stranded DNA-binding protein (plasmid) [Salmonella enterica subsp. diarizonae]|nr:single-stranded DNA-binding protein [Salmonella enterica]WKN80519.1 single-stranded DNA-binding protein [Salmonella enterica subsp. diarizonae]